ncbi:MAG: glycosyltransferase [Gammaproteobacteria bacterium]|nr:glycosyltransferase [Gammaproteobacteria bacterium]MDH3537309.1 glycosyltransferase [Gammaproteobacteria bacterium]
MRICVVIPSHNRSATLTRALQSVYDQSSPVDEVILVDDGSTDASSDLVARRFPEVKILHQANLGVSAARNRGIAAAGCEWIALLDSDDSWLPHKIRAVRDAWRKAPEFVLFHSDEIWMRNGIRVNPMRKHRKDGGWIFEKCLQLCAISPSATVMQKTTLCELGMFDDTLPACEDYDLWLRLCHRHPVYYIDQALIVKHGGHADQLSRRYPAMDQYRLRALHRLLLSGDLPVDYFRAAESVFLRKLEILINGAEKHRNQALIDEFGPLREAWRRHGETPASC